MRALTGCFRLFDPSSFPQPSLLAVASGCHVENGLKARQFRSGKQSRPEGARGIGRLRMSARREEANPAVANRNASPRECSSLGEYRENMTFGSDGLGRIVQDFEEQMKSGLRKGGNLLMIPTLVDVIPDGHEEGGFWGIEIGGSKLRIVHTVLGKERHEVLTVQVSVEPVPDEKRRCPASELFDYIVNRMRAFACSIGRDLSKEDIVVVGLCFSFPMEHKSIKSGKLIKWTKGYNNAGAVGKDPVRLLVEAFNRQNISVNVGALVNDTVAILCAERYKTGPDANIAVIMGTGTNACYVEQTRNITKLKLKYFTRTPDMIVNIEWPGFLSDAVPLLLEDAELDKESNKPGDQKFEKLTAGLYMGDIGRRIMHRLSKRWFESSETFLDDPSRFSTIELAAIAQDEDDNLDTTADILAPIVQSTPDEISLEIRTKAKYVCRLVTIRSAQLTAAAMVGILHHIERSQHHSSELNPRNVIAIEGGIFTEYPLYCDLVHDAVRIIAGREFATNFKLQFSDGGAAFGAAAVAAAGFKYDKVMGHVADNKAPRRKFPPRRTSQSDLSSVGSEDKSAGPSPRD